MNMSILGNILSTLGGAGGSGVQYIRVFSIN